MSKGSSIFPSTPNLYNLHFDIHSEMHKKLLHYSCGLPFTFGWSSYDWCCLQKFNMSQRHHCVSYEEKMSLLMSLSLLPVHT